MSDFKSRIFEVANYYGISIRKLEEKCSLNRGNISNITGTIGADKLSKIFDACPHISWEWMLTGRGEMLKPSSNTTTSITPIVEDGLVEIPIVDISAAAGAGYCNNDHLEVIDNIKMPALLISNHGNRLCIRSRGDSMAPTILDSSYLIIRQVKPCDWVDIRDNHVHVVSDRDGHTFVKRIKNRLRQRGEIVLTSDNPDKRNYSNFNLHEDQINTIWYVEWNISARLPNYNEDLWNKINDIDDRVYKLEYSNKLLK